MLMMMSRHPPIPSVFRALLLVLAAVALPGLGPAEVAAKPSSQSASKAPETKNTSAKKGAVKKNPAKKAEAKKGEAKKGAVKKNPAKKAETKKAMRKKHPARRARSRRRRVKTRCRDIFCTTQVVRMDSSTAEGQALTETQVETTITKHRERWDPCLVNVRRRDPNKKVARLEFVVTGKGKVLATRVDGKRYSWLSKCMLRKMRGVSFPTFKQPRAVASVTLAIPQ